MYDVLDVDYVDEELLMLISYDLYILELDYYLL